MKWCVLPTLHLTMTNCQRSKMTRQINEKHCVQRCHNKYGQRRDTISEMRLSVDFDNGSAFFEVELEEFEILVSSS